jgi:hypothetical protein
VRLLRLSHFSDAGQHRVEISVEVPRMARRVAIARFAFAVPPLEQDLIRWYFEVSPGLDRATAGLGATDAKRQLVDRGRELFRSVFEANLDTRRIWAAVQPELAGFRVEIVTDVAGATALPWESMTDQGGRPLALDAAALVRAHPQAALIPKLPTTGIPVRVLLVISRPGVYDVPYRSVAYQLTRLMDDDGGLLRLDVLRPPTFAHLARTLRAAKDSGRPYQVVHFDGHGVWGDANDSEWLRTFIPAAEAGRTGRWLVSPARPGAHGYLRFEQRGAAGPEQLVDGPVLGNLLADVGVPLLVLNACRSAMAEPPTARAVASPHAEVRAYGSLAQEVMDAGVAGVLAMRYDVYVTTAARFVADLYAGLLTGLSFGAAVRDAREHLAGRPAGEAHATALDWMVPVAYEAAPLQLTEPASGAGTPPAAGSAATGPATESGLPAESDLGLFGRDALLLALDRAFDSQPIALIHGEAGIGKTATAAEFGRWYLRTGGVSGPVVYSSVARYATPAALAAALNGAPGLPPVAADGLTGAQHLLLAGEVMRRVPLLWIWDDIDQDPDPCRSRELLSLLHAARESRAKLLLVSRDDQQAWLGNLPVRLQLPPLPLVERNLLVRALGARHGVQISGLSVSARRSLGGNPGTLIDLTEAALRAGCATKVELETFMTTAGRPRSQAH